MMLKSSQGKNTREGFQFLGAWSQLKTFGTAFPKGNPRGLSSGTALNTQVQEWGCWHWSWVPPLTSGISQCWEQLALPPMAQDPPALCSEPIPALQHSAIPPANPAGLQQEELLLCAQRCPRAQLLRLPKPVGTRTSTHLECIPEWQVHATQTKAETNSRLKLATNSY